MAAERNQRREEQAWSDVAWIKRRAAFVGPDNRGSARSATESWRRRSTRSVRSRPIETIAGADVSYDRSSQVASRRRGRAARGHVRGARSLGRRGRGEVSVCSGLLDVPRSPRGDRGFSQAHSPAGRDHLRRTGDRASAAHGAGRASGALSWIFPRSAVPSPGSSASIDEPGPERGDWSPLTDQGETIGAVLRTRSRVKPLFVSQRASLRPGERDRRRAGHVADVSAADHDATGASVCQRPAAAGFLRLIPRLAAACRPPLWQPRALAGRGRPFFRRLPASSLRHNTKCLPAHTLSTRNAMVVGV